MSVRKRQMVYMVVGLVLCGLVILVFGDLLVQWDRNEYTKKCESYEGTWWDKEEEYGLEIHRVTSGYLYCSIINEKCSRKLRLLTAYSVGNDTYEFSYRTEPLAGSLYKILAGTEGKGTIALRDDSVVVHFPELPDKKRILEYDGTLTKKIVLQEEKTIHLMDYMGTDRQMPEDEELSSYCSFYYDDRGKIWRIHAMLAEKLEYYKTDIAGISMTSSPQECNELLGNLILESQLGNGEYRRQYQNDTYLSTVITNSFGVITELDCQLLDLPDTSRQGDFLMRGDTLYRYAGDYSAKKTIELPEGIKRIASHAFDAGEHGYYISSTKRNKCYINIPDDVVVEEDAFANCGPLAICLMEGWREIPKGAFAHMVSLKSVVEKQDWITIYLPASLKKINESAFSLREPDMDLDAYWQLCSAVENPPVSIATTKAVMKNVTYIGDDAFWGIEMKQLPSGLNYLGKNYTLNVNYFDVLDIPEKITTLKEDTLYFREEDSYVDLQLPQRMKEIEDGAIRGGFISAVHIKGKKGNLQQDEYGWLRSRDGKTLYFIDDSYYYKLLDDNRSERYKEDSRYVAGDGMVRVVKIPEGIEDIRRYVNLKAYPKVVFPTSLKRMNVMSLLNGYWNEIIFQGDVPELYGDVSSIIGDEGQILILGKIKVKKGQKEKMLEQLLAGEKAVTEEQKKQLARHITTF